MMGDDEDRNVMREELRSVHHQVVSAADSAAQQRAFADIGRIVAVVDRFAPALKLMMRVRVLPCVCGDELGSGCSEVPAARHAG